MTDELDQTLLGGQLVGQLVQVPRELRLVRLQLDQIAGTIPARLAVLEQSFQKCRRARLRRDRSRRCHLRAEGDAIECTHRSPHYRRWIARFADGIHMAETARIDRPDLKVLFITGYPVREPIDINRPATAMQMLTKPFTLETLASRIAAILRTA